MALYFIRISDTLLKVIFPYSAIKNEAVLPFTTTWMDLGGIMLSEISQTEIQILCDFTYMVHLKKRKNPNSEKEVRLVVTRGRGWGRGDWRKVEKGRNFQS